MNCFDTAYYTHLVLHTNYYGLNQIPRKLCKHQLNQVCVWGWTQTDEVLMKYSLLMKLIFFQSFSVRFCLCLTHFFQGKWKRISRGERERDACVSCMCIIPSLYVLPKYTVLCVWSNKSMHVCLYETVSELPPMHHRGLQWGGDERWTLKQYTDWKRCLV